MGFRRLSSVLKTYEPISRWKRRYWKNSGRNLVKSIKTNRVRNRRGILQPVADVLVRKQWRHAAYKVNKQEAVHGGHDKPCPQNRDQAAKDQKGRVSGRQNFELPPKTVWAADKPRAQFWSPVFEWVFKTNLKSLT